MGFTLSHEEPHMHEEIKSDLNELNINKIIEVADVINVTCGGRVDLYYEEFEDIFTLILKYPRTFFEHLQIEPRDGPPYVNIYETITSLTLLCQDCYEKKIAYLFAIFDFDYNFVLNRTEFDLTVSTTMKAMAKIVNVSVPSETDIKYFGNAVFSHTDLDFNHCINADELSEYLKHNYDMQDFLLRYTGSTSHENATRRFNDFKQYGENAFKEYEAQFEDMKERTLKLLLMDIYKVKDNIAEEVILISKMHVKTDPIQKKIFLDLVKAMSAYAAIDINQRGEINKVNYYQMIWLYDGTEPDDYKVKIGLDRLDIDKNGNIDLLEWISFLSMVDAITGNQYFVGRLRQSFLQLDTDNSGYLEKEELKQMLYKTLSEWGDKIGNKTSIEQDKKATLAMLGGIVNKIFRNMNINKLTWNEFSEFISQSTEELDEQKKFWQNHLYKPTNHYMAHKIST